MTPKHICIIDGHPDPDTARYIHALCHAYQEGAEAAGHYVDRINISDLDIEGLGSKADFETPPDMVIRSERGKIANATHIVIAFPLWLGGMPAKLKAFFEQVARDNFFLQPANKEMSFPMQMMTGKSARVIVTMGMPSLFYRFGLDAGSLKALERAMLGLSGFKPIKHRIIGGVDAATPAQRHKWLDEMKSLGAKAE